MLHKPVDGGGHGPQGFRQPQTPRRAGRGAIAVDDIDASIVDVAQDVELAIVEPDLACELENIALLLAGEHGVGRENGRAVRLAKPNRFASGFLLR